jgi:ATP-dependent Clp protease ATP-binding subunit ClpA
MIGKRAEEVLNRAVRFAFERRQEYFTLEHVLLSLLEETDILDMVRACGGKDDEMRRSLEDYLDREVPKRAQAEDDDPDTDEDEDSESQANRAAEQHPVATLSIQRLIQRALFQVQSSGKDEIQPKDLFVALFQAKDSYALHLLTQQGVERLEVIKIISHGSEESASEEKQERPPAQGSGEKSVSDALENYTLHLNREAKKGKIDPLVGRAPELERMIQTLGRRRKNNPLLVGEAGVGKTAIVEGLADRIVQGAVPEFLKSAEVYSLDMGSLLAGAKFRGDFEQRLKKVLKALQAKRESGSYPILFVDEIHTLVGAGAVSGSVLDAANLLKPYLSRGDLQCIGSTTYNEYRTVFEKDHALARRFQKIDVNEPSTEEAIQILQGLKPKFEEHHQVNYTPEAIRGAVELAVKHINDRFLPDKAIDVLDEVGARTKIQKSGPEVGLEQVEEMVAKIARIPARSVSVNQKTRLKNLERDLKLAIFGQDSAIESIVTQVRLARSGLRTGDKPIGAFLFCGPTGVGKTELTKQLAASMGIPLLRYDMSEYMEKHTVSRLIGAPPGYVGFEQAGMLTDAVNKNPSSVILLDEIEKAHPDLWNILLQIMDHGTLTDNNGKKADFRNTVIIMTSNVGARDAERRPLGMNASRDRSSVTSKEVERTFSPEFRNRLDAIVYFKPLDPITIGQVVGKQLVELETQLLAKNIEIEVTSDAREWLGTHGYDPSMGARPMARLIQEKIKRPLSEEILFGKLEHGGKVRVDVERGEFVFSYTPSPTESSAQRSARVPAQ